MNEETPNARRATAAALAIVDWRELEERTSILVTAEHAMAVVLLMVRGGDARAAALLLNEELVPGIEDHLAHYASQGGQS